MASKMCWWAVLCLFLLVVSPGRCEETLGVLGDFHLGPEADEDRAYDPVKSGWRDAEGTPRNQPIPFLESQHALQPVAPAAKDGNGDIPPPAEDHGQEEESEAQKSHALSGLGAFYALNSKNQAGIEGPARKEEMEGEAENGQGGGGYRANIPPPSQAYGGVTGEAGHSPQSYTRNKITELGQEGEKQTQHTQPDGGPLVEIAHSNYTQVLGVTTGSFETPVNSETATERKSEIQPYHSLFHNTDSAQNLLNTGNVEGNAGALGTSDSKPLSPEDVNTNPVRNVSDRRSNNMSSMPPRNTEGPAEKVSRAGSYDIVGVKENQANDNLQSDQEYEDIQNTPATYVFKENDDKNFTDDMYIPRGNDTETGPEDDENFRDNIYLPGGNDLETGLKDDIKVSTSDESVLESPQQQFANDANSEADEKEDDSDDDFSDTETDGDDWWYYDPDTMAGKTGWPTSFTPEPWTEDGREEVDEQEGKGSSDFPSIHEGVIEIADIMEKKNKKMNGPKESVILYTTLVVILIAGIVIFALWKNAFKRTRPRNPASTVETGEEGERLLDHPFV